MFISVGNFINSGCHVKENCRPAAARIAGELGYPDAARCWDLFVTDSSILDKR